MKLILLRDQAETGMMSKKITFSVVAKVEITEEDRVNIQKYKLGDTLLFTNMADRGSGVLGAISRKSMAVELTIDDLVDGKKFACKDILEMLALEDIIIEVSHTFQKILKASTTFGGEAVIEL